MHAVIISHVYCNRREQRERERGGEIEKETGKVMEWKNGSMKERRKNERDSEGRFYAVAKNFDWRMRSGRPVSMTLFVSLSLAAYFLLKSCLWLSGFASDNR